MSTAGIWNRRIFLSSVGAMAAAAWPGSALARGRKAAASASGDIYKELGVKTIINAWGTITLIGGSLIPPEAVAAMSAAAEHYVSIPDLLEATGDRIAKMLKDLPADHSATITSGAAGAIMSGVAGTLTGENKELIRQLPDLTGMKSEVLMLKSQHRHYGYNPQILASGVKIVEVESPDDVSRAVSEKTALMFFANYMDDNSEIKVADWAKLGKQHNVPTFNDCAADTPPVSHLTDYNNMGYDLVAFSGGKGLRGPQCSGLLLGRKDLVRAARFNGAPFAPTIGRGMKVGKEEIVGMWKALEVYLSSDHEKLTQEWWDRLHYISKELRSFSGVYTADLVPPIANHVPTMRVEWDAQKVGLTSAQARAFLESDDPAVMVGGGPGDNAITMTSFMLKPGEERLIASRLKAMFKAHKA
ncbi:MAG TPA: selenocysteine synthase [Terriglobia bacterium]|nr:selenocysteine synthase [Terriglobia bacterium]